MQHSITKLEGGHTDASTRLLGATEETLAHGILADSLRSKILDLERQHSVVCSTAQAHDLDLDGDGDGVGGERGALRVQLAKLRAGKDRLDAELAALRRTRTEADRRREDQRTDALANAEQRRQDVLQKLKDTGASVRAASGTKKDLGQDLGKVKEELVATTTTLIETEKSLLASKADGVSTSTEQIDELIEQVEQIENMRVRSYATLLDESIGLYLTCKIARY